jgi:hypothetical protein
MTRLLLAYLVLLAAAPVLAQEPPKAKKLPFTVSKETTYVLGPVDKDGYIDYVAALNQRLGKGVTAETNANVRIWQAVGPTPEGGRGQPAEFYKYMGIDPPPAAGEYFVDFYKYARDALGVVIAPDVNDDLSVAGRYPWTAKDYPTVAVWLAAMQKPMDLVVEGCGRPHYYSPMVPTVGPNGPQGLISCLLPAIQKCRSLAVALTTRAMLRLGEGKTAAAWADLVAAHRLARHIGRGSTLIEGLVSIAIEAIVSHRELVFLDRAGLDAKGIRACVRDLDALPPIATAADMVDHGERFFFLETVMRVAAKGPGPLGELGLGILNESDPRLPKRAFEDVDWDPALRDGNLVFDRLSAALRDPDLTRRKAAFDKLEAQFKQLRADLADPDRPLFEPDAAPQTKGKVFGELFLCTLLPAVTKVSVASDRAQQTWANLRVAFALAEYRAEHKAYPKALDELAPKYLAKVPGDLFTGKPLTYRPMGNGYLLYSFGQNGKDEEGRWFDDEPRGDDPRVLMPVIPPAKK